jgi:hypothetical protein
MIESIAGQGAHAMPIYIDLCTEAAQRIAAEGAQQKPARMAWCSLRITGGLDGIAAPALISLVA